MSDYLSGFLKHAAKFTPGTIVKRRNTPHGKSCEYFLVLKQQNSNIIAWTKIPLEDLKTKQRIAEYVQYLEIVDDPAAIILYGGANVKANS